MEKETVDEDEKASNAKEPNNRPYDSQEGDNGKILEKEGLSKTVARREDNRRQNDGEEYLIVELYFLIQRILRYSCSNHAHENSHRGLMNVGNFLELDNM